MATERNIQYEIKKPSLVSGKGKRKTFAIQKTTFTDDGRKVETVEIERIAALNLQYLNKESTFEQTFQLFKEVRDDLKKERLPKAKPLHNSENLALLDRYWDEEYQYRDIASPETMRSEMENALTLLGSISLMSASKEDLQKYINALPITNNKQRRLIDRLHALLKYAKRDVRLKKKKKDPKDIKYVFKKELPAVLIHIRSDVLKLATRIAFESGLRVGEIFGLKREQCKGHQVYVERQLLRKAIQKKRKKTHGPTKTDRSRFLYCTSDGVEAIDKWFAIDEKDRNKYRNHNHSDIIKKACKKAFPKDPVKWIDFHSMRHSYAINLIGRGVSISLVAQSLGNSISVCQEYYGGFSLTSESVANISNILGEHEWKRKKRRKLKRRRPVRAAREPQKDPKSL